MVSRDVGTFASLKQLMSCCACASSKTTSVAVCLLALDETNGCGTPSLQKDDASFHAIAGKQNHGKG